MDRNRSPRNAASPARTAGMMLGFLLARAGIDVVVLEKHGDFLRASAATPFTPRRSTDARTRPAR